LLSPLFLAAIFGTNLLLLGQWSYRCTLGVQIVFYAAALIGCASQNSRRKIPLLGIPYVFCLLNWATRWHFSVSSPGASASPGKRQ